MPSSDQLASLQDLVGWLQHHHRNMITRSLSAETVWARSDSSVSSQHH